MTIFVGYSFTALVTTDSDGDNTVAAQAVEVRNELDGALSTIYSDSAGTTPISQPGAVTDSNGVLEFWVEPGYYTITSGTRTENVLIDHPERTNPDTIAIAKASKHLKIGEKIETKGYTSVNDGGGAKYVVVAGGTGTDDGGSYHDMSNGNQLELMHDNAIHVRKFGTTGDGVAFDDPEISNACAALSEGYSLVFGAGDTYLFQGNNLATIAADRVNIIGNKAIIAAENSSNPEVTTGGAFNSGLLITGEEVILKDLKIRGGLISVQSSVFYAENCEFENLHNVGIGGSSSVGFEYWHIKDCHFKTSLDTSVGNFSAISRGGTDGVDPLAETVIIENCTFEGLAGGVNFHVTENVILINPVFKGGDVNHIKVDQGSKRLVVVNPKHDGAAINGASANRHLNSGIGYAGFINSGDDEIIIENAYLENCNGTAGYDFVDSTTLKTVRASLYAKNCTAPVWKRAPGYLNLYAHVENCGNDAVQIAHPLGVWALDQTVRGYFLDSQLTVGNSSTSAPDFKRIDIKINGENTTGGDIIKAVDTSPTAGSEIDEAYVHDSHLKVSSGTALNGSNGSFNLLISPTNTYEGATTDFTGQYELDYDTGGSGTFPKIRRGIYRWRTTGGAITRTIADANAQIGDEIEVTNDSGSGNVSLVVTSGSIDGFGTTQVTPGATLRIKKVASADWQSLYSRGTINQF